MTRLPLKHQNALDIKKETCCQFNEAHVIGKWQCRKGSKYQKMLNCPRNPFYRLLEIKQKEYD